jgi:RHS repeat-associated protein
MRIKAYLISILSQLAKPAVELSLANYSLGTAPRRVKCDAPANSSAGGPTGPLYQLLLAFAFVTCSLTLSATVRAQSSSGFVNNITAVPVPGVGHDYIHDLDEIVNPANGSLSIRIEAPRPKERSWNYPLYSFMYDSTQQFTIQYNVNTNGGSYACGPDTNGSDGSGAEPPQPLTCIFGITFPYRSISYTTSGYPAVLSGPNSMISSPAEFSRYVTGGTYYTCNLIQSYSYEDPYGVIHDLGVYSVPQAPSFSGACQYLGISYNPIGGDDQYKIVLNDVPSGISIPQNGTLTSGYGMMIDTHGNAVQVLELGAGPSPVALEDTNGNAVNGTGRSGSYQSFQPWGDALAKTASRTFAGGATYNYTWGTATTSYSPASVDETVIQLGYDNLCSHTGSLNFGFLDHNSNPVVVQMLEPDGLYYTFSYDPYYGLLNKITYPTGAWVQYTWGVNSLSDATGFTTPGQFVNNFNDPIHLTSGQTMNAYCLFRHDTPAIVKRVVSYDGTNPAMEQDFSYSTTWQSGGVYGNVWLSKQTVVTTKDLLSAGTPSFKTIYNYSPYFPYYDIGNHLLSSQLPVESSIVYQDVAGNVLNTVTKTWNYNNQLAAECTTLPNGKTSGTFYQYEPYPLSGADNAITNPSAVTTNLHTDVAEYDYGLITTPCQKPTTTPTKETVITYANFANTPLWPTFSESGVQESMPPMVDRPATVITYQNGTRAAETDYSYDQTAVAPVSSPIGHDENNYGSGTAPRGNVTTVTRKCFQGSTSCADSVTRITYDTTGQPVSVTDPKNNQTTLSYADNYTTDDGSPSGNTNTYLTKITRPTTSGASHIETFQWDFNKGQLRTLTDENNNQSSYQYADPWWRLTKSTFPDGGSVTNTYQDAGPHPTITTNSLVASGVSLTSTTIMDGLGHVIHTQLNSDPDGVDYVDQVYDGLGRVASVSNPYRSTSDSTYGVTTFSYDSLGRKTVQVQPDGGKVQWCYNDIPSSGQTNCAGNVSTQTNAAWTDSSDEAGNRRQHTHDSFGRLIEVDEPGSGGVSATAGTGAASIGGSEQSIGGTPATSGTGSVTFSGTLQNKVSQPATSGSGSVAFSGSLQSKQVQTQAATAGVGSVTLSGNERSTGGTPSTGYFSFNVYVPGNNSSETITLNVNGSALASQFYTASISGYTLAQNFANQINGNSSALVTASYSGNSGSSGPGTLYLTSKAIGTSANYSLSYSCSFCGSYTSYSGMSGGTNPFYDNGTVSVTVNGIQASVSYGQNSTAANLASALVTAINGNTSIPVTAGVSGATVSLTAKTTGTGTDYSLSVSSVTSNTHFQSGSTSFPISRSGATLTGGLNAVYTTVYDSGSCTVTVNSHGDSSSWSGSGTTISSIASVIASAISGDGGAFVSASASGGTVNLTARTTGTGTNYGLSSSCSYDSSNFSGPSFATSNSGSSLTGGRDNGYVYDSGTSTIMVNGHADSVNWSGSGTTTISIASALASSINADSGASVTASASGATVSLTAKTNGVSTNYSLSSSSTHDSSDFSNPSFSSGNSGSTLTGGSNGTATVYDTGTVWIKVGGFQASASYGLTDTTNSVVTGLGNALNSASSPVTASISGPSLNLTAKATGANTNFTLSGGSSTSQPSRFSQPSFTISFSGSTLTGGGSPTLSLSTPAVTTYNYDGLDNLISVVQSGSRQRTFTYDSLSRLGSATNPETATITYGHDANGNIVAKTAPAPNQPGSAAVTTTYSYDALNRTIQKSYSDGTPTVTYGYDGVSPSGCTLPPSTAHNGVGQLTGMCDAGGAEAWSYDIVSGTGWKTTDVRTTSGVTLPTIVQKNLDGSVNSITYPSGHILTYAPGGAGRPLSAIDSTSNLNYASQAQYWPSGALAAIRNNGGSIASNTILNSRLQPCWVYATNGTGLQWNSPNVCSASAATGSILDLRLTFNLGSADNGNVAGITNNRDTTRSQTFSYDPLNRLTMAQTTATYSTSTANCWGESFSYDPWGNLLSISESSSNYDGCTYEQPQGWTIGANNQIQSTATCFDSSGNLLTVATHCYDAAGNLLTNMGLSFSYDAENYLKSIPMLGITYLYDGHGHRVAKLNRSGQATKLYWYGPDSDPLDETDGTGANNNSNFYEYAFFNGQRVARRDYQNNVDYYFADHLGSARVVTNSAGTILDDSDFYPFGGERAVVTPSSGNSYLFTGKERDSESGLDNFGGRYFGSSIGRLMSLDPTNQGVDFYYPQTWNRYAYALDNPLSIVDNNGLWPTRIHESIINNAFPGLSNSQRQNLKTASKDVDRDQSVEGSYKHGMSNGNDPNGSVNALQDSQNFIDQNEHDAEAIQDKWIAEGNTGIAPAAMTAFGNALHTITDETSPAHEGYQPWYGVWSIEAIIHVAREQYISPARMNQATNAARSAFRKTFGDRLYWLAIGQQPRQREKVTVRILGCRQTNKQPGCG